MAPRHPKISWWMQVRWFVRYMHTPLRLRSSIVRLSHNHKHPYLLLLSFFIPFPSWYFSVPEPTPPRDILGNPSLLQSLKGDIVNLRTIPIWRARDTSIRSLYRLYEAMASGNYAPIGPETEYFWYQSRKQWAAHLIEDPKDPDPVRYAILACLAEELVAAFNWRLSLGMRRNRQHLYRERNGDPYPPFEPERLPGWTKKVPPIEPWMVADLPPSMLDSEKRLVLEEGGSSEVFAKRNIVTNVGWLYTI